MVFEGFPLIIGWELTLACNLRCEHCGSTAGLPRSDELTLEESLAICDQLPDLLVSEVDFTGGEPLVRKDWFEILVHLRELKIKTRLISNGLLLNPDTISRINGAGVERVGVSIDGLEETHDYIRKRPGLFRHVVNGIECLLRSGIPVSVITTVNALNIRQLPQLLSLLRSLGVDIWQFQPLFPLGRARGCAELSLSESAYNELGEFVRDYMLPEANGGPLLSPGDSFGYYTEMDRRQPAWGGCSAGLDLCGITSDGRIKGCLSMPDELAEGDLRSHDLWDIWFDPEAFSYNRKFSTTALGSNCSLCRFGEKCRGGCSSMSYACSGVLHNDPYCFLGIENRASSV